MNPRHAGRVAVVVRVEPVSWERGLWCNVCMKSTGLNLLVAVTIAGRMCLHPDVWCPEHEGRDGIEAGG